MKDLHLIERLNAWNEGRKRRRNARIYNRLVKDPLSGMNQEVQRHVTRLAIEHFMKMLDAEGFTHCQFCPARQPLTKHPMGMMCPGHLEMVNRAPIEKEEVKA